MRIQRIHIENFGKLHDFALDLQGGLNVVRGENGWGKSTLAAFIKAMFYGLDYTTKRSLKENERKKYMPWQGGLFGGSLEFQTGEKSYRVERSFGAKDKEDTFVIYDLDTGLESEDFSARLGEELFRLDRAAFERSSFLGQQDIAVSVNDSLSAGLTHLEEDAGDMQNYEKAAASLEERMKYYQKTGGRGQIGKLEEARREVRERLIECRNKEAASAGWRMRIEEKERREKELLDAIQDLEVRVQKARAYGEKRAKKEQHDLLKEQAFAQEEKLRQTAAALAEFTGVPAGEEELDRCREMLYRIDTLCKQQEGYENRLREKKDELEQLERSVGEIPKPNLLLRVLMSFLIVAGVTAIIGRILPGVFVLAAGLAIAFLEMRKERQAKQQREALESDMISGRQELKEAEEMCRRKEEERGALEDQVHHILHTSKETDWREMEYLWKMERQRSQEYGMLKQAYESRRKEARRSREAWIAFRGRFSEEELSDFLNLQESEKEPAELQRELEICRRQREELIKEKGDLGHQLRMLEEKAEQIPELEEEEERLSRELEDAVREHGLLEKTLKYLKTAREQFSTRYLRELQQGLWRYMELLEPEQKPEPSVDVKLKLKVREAGASRDLDCFSAGWQDLFRIAERFSIVDALYKEEQPVLILDDPFVNLDTKKQKRAMELLEKLSEKRQMIYFTCRI